MVNVGFCGVGNMSGAILSAALSSGTVLPEQIFAYNPSREKLDAYNGVNVASSNVEVCRNSDIVFLGFKPQKLAEIGEELKGKLAGKCIVSLLAGVSVDKLRSVLGEAYYIRVMPNTPMTVGMGCTAIADSDAPHDTYEIVRNIFKASGEVVEVTEAEINKTIPLSSSSPAFFFRFIRAMCESGVKHGMEYEKAKTLAISTLHGVAHLMEKSDKSPDELIAQVTSPGGTTLAGLTAFDDFEFEKMMDSVFERTINRAEELGK